MHWITDFVRDVRHAVRMAGGHLTFTVGAVATLAVGIGSAAAIFSIAHAILVQPLPFPKPDRLVLIREPEMPRSVPLITYQEYLDWRSRLDSMSGLAAQSGVPQLILPTPAGTARFTAATISTNYFDVLGVRAAIGRTITEADDADPNVAVLTHGTWRTFFGADPRVVGTSLVVKGAIGGPSNLGANPEDPGRVLAIVGVLPESFEVLGAAANFYTPIVARAGGSPAVSLVGRVRAEVPLPAAEEEANGVGNAVRPPRPADEPPLTGPRFRLVPMKEALVDGARPVLRVFLAGVGVLMLLVCASVANLLLARGASRRRELAVRAAVGATRGRLARQLTAECLVLAGAGGLAGVAFGAAAIHLVKRLATVDAEGIFRLAFGGHLLPRISEWGVDARVLVAAALLATAATVLFGLLPVLRLSRASTMDAASTRGAGGTAGDTWTRRVLVVTQLAMATALLVSAGLLVASYAKLSAVDKGYEPRRALAFQLVLPAEYPTARKADTIEALLVALERLPDVVSAGFAYAGILLGVEDTIGVFVPPGRTPEEMQSAPARPRLKSISGGYLQAMGVPLLSGRHLDARDGATAPLAALINRSVARALFAEQDPVGRTMTWHHASAAFPVEIVGVVEDVRQGRLAQPPYPSVYMDYRQVLEVQRRLGTPPPRQEQIAFGFLSFGVRTRDDPAQAIPVVRGVVRRVDPNAGIDAIHTMDRMVGYSVARQRFHAVLLGLFAGAAGLLAAIGVYAVLAYSVSRRTAEIGIRMALGATRADVMALVFGRGAAMTSIGIGAGLAIAAGGARSLQSMLFEVAPGDPATFAGAAALVAVVSLAAAYIPARRATRVDPVAALRAE